MQSLWRQNTTLPQFPTLSGNLKTQAIVIGGGLAGILTAYFLEPSFWRPNKSAAVKAAKPLQK